MSEQTIAEEWRTVKGAMTPIVWISSISSPACFGAAYLLREDTSLRGWLVTLGAVPILVACGVYVFFAVWSPDRLKTTESAMEEGAWKSPGGSATGHRRRPG